MLSQNSFTKAALSRYRRSFISGKELFLKFETGLIWSRPGELHCSSGQITGGREKSWMKKFATSTLSATTIQTYRERIKPLKRGTPHTTGKGIKSSMKYMPPPNH